MDEKVFDNNAAPVSENHPENEDFAAMLASYEKESEDTVNVGDKVEVKVIAVGSDTIFVDTHTKTDGCVDIAEFMDADGNVTAKVGDMLPLYVIAKTESEIRLSKGLTSKNSAADTALQTAFDEKIPVEGKVTGAIKGGYNVDVLGKRAFCPGSRMDTRRNTEDTEYIGKTFNFIITKYENNGRNLVVDRRGLLEAAADKIRAEFYDKMQIGDIYDAAVERIMPFGAFVSVSEGVEGLVHISELGWSRVEDPHHAVHVGDKVKVKLLGSQPDPKNSKAQKLSFSIKQAGESPWSSISDNLKIGEIYTGTVIRTAPFGAFVEVLPGVEGLVHLSEMSYTKRINRAEEAVSVGQKVPVVVKEVDPGKQRVSLSIRDAEGDPWAGVAERYTKGEMVATKVLKHENFGILLELTPGVVGLMPRSFLESATDSAKLKETKPGDTVKVKVERVDADKRQIALAPLSMEEAEEDWNKFNTDTKTTDIDTDTGFNSLAEKLAAAMNKK